MPTPDKQTQEQALQYPLGDRLPALGEVIEVAPGVRWLRMGLPFALDHINLWALRDRHGGRDGWTLVDCGIANEATQTAWEQVFAEGLEGLPILRVLVTHMHPDHIGLAHWLTQRWSTPQHECRLWISGTDYNAARILSGQLTADQPGAGSEAAASFMRSHGLTDPASLEQVRARRHYYPTLVPRLPERFRRLMDGDRVRVGLAGETSSWQCIAGYGHAPEHMSLHNPSLGVLISGDMVLPRISTNVSVYDLEPESDPLQLYLNSLARMRDLPDDTLVLPSHGRPFRGLQTRLAQLQAHHQDRLAETIALCRERPSSAFDLLKVMFRRPLDLHQTTFAIGESIAHLNLLWHAGQLVREMDAEQIWRYRPA